MATSNLVDAEFSVSNIFSILGFSLHLTKSLLLSLPINGAERGGKTHHMSLFVHYVFIH